MKEMREKREREKAVKDQFKQATQYLPVSPYISLYLPSEKAVKDQFKQARGDIGRYREI